LDPQLVISSLNSREKRGTLHCLAASGSFHAPSFHAGPKLGVTNSKKSKNAKPSRGIILCDLEAGKKFKPKEKIVYQKVPSQK
jgi:hypothetical protein